MDKKSKPTFFFPESPNTMSQTLPRNDIFGINQVYNQAHTMNYMDYANLSNSNYGPPNYGPPNYVDDHQSENKVYQSPQPMNRNIFEDQNSWFNENNSNSLSQNGMEAGVGGGSNDMDIESESMLSRSNSTTNQNYGSLPENFESKDFVWTKSASVCMNTINGGDWNSNQQSENKQTQTQKPKNMNLIKKWKKNDKIFVGKYSSGATPNPKKQKHNLLNLIRSQSLSITSTHLFAGMNAQNTINHDTRNSNIDFPVSQPNTMAMAQTQVIQNKNDRFKKTNSMPVSSLFNEFYGPSTHKLPSNLEPNTDNEPQSSSNNINFAHDFHRHNETNENSLPTFPNKRLFKQLTTIQEEAAFLGQACGPHKNSSRLVSNILNNDRINLDGVVLPPQSDLVASPKYKEEDLNGWFGENSITPNSKSQNLDDWMKGLKTPDSYKKNLDFDDELEEGIEPISTGFIDETLKKDNQIKSLVVPTTAIQADIFASSLLNNNMNGIPNQAKALRKEPSMIDSDDIYTQPMTMLINFPRFAEDFIKLDKLGEGRFGIVYKCENKLDGLVYAVKCMRKKLNGNENLHQVLEEAHTLASLSSSDDNPFVVRYYNAWIEDDKLFLVMEYCQHNLIYLINQNIKHPETNIRQLMRDICMGLRHLHQHKIVHLDLKPTSIMYGKTNKYKIGDLGEAKIARQFDEDDIKEEDSRYTAPELLVDHDDNTLPDLTKADIYSFGAILWELIVGGEYTKNYELMCNKLDQQDISVIYSQSLRGTIKSMINPSPALRPTAASLIADFLQSEIEIELKWEKNQNKELEKKLDELEKILKIPRKNTI